MDTKPADEWPEFRVHVLPGGAQFLQGELPETLRLSRAEFESLWAEHPAEYPVIRMGNRMIPTPRWGRAYGRPYHQTGGGEDAPAHLQPYLEGARTAVDPRLNTLHIQWYDAALGHYIGKHRDYRGELVRGSPIVTISLGSDRVFRLTPPAGRGSVDFAARDGTVFVIPYETNLTWMHGVPKLARDRGRRISITLRAGVG